MAKRPAKARKPARDDGLGPIVAAAIALAAESDWREIGLSEIASAAGIKLSDLLVEYPSKMAILDAFSKAIDRKVLAEFAPDADSSSARDRLFDVLMQRFDALETHKEAVRRLLAAAWGDPLVGLCAGSSLLRSMGLMLEAAGVPSDGLRGAIKSKALATIYAATLRAWLKDDTTDKSRTMAALDGRLRRAEGWANSLKSMPFGRRTSQGKAT
jgi:AcrR family transcriptional regulator